MTRDYAGDWRRAAEEIDRIAKMIEDDRATDSDDHLDGLADVAAALRASAAEYEQMHQSR